MKNENLNLENTQKVLKIIHNTAAEIEGGSTNFEIETTQKDFVFFKKFFYKVILDLNSVKSVDNLELIFKIIHPNKAILISQNNSNLEISKNLIIWELNPGHINSIEFSFWSWNILLIGISFILILILITYLLRFYRFKLGTDLPQLPPK